MINTTTANNAKFTTTTTKTMQTILNSLLTKVIVFQPAVKKTVAVGAMVKNPKTGKGKVTRRIVNSIKLGFQVINTQATLLARKEAVKSLLVRANEIEVAANFRIKARRAEKEEAKVYADDMNASQVYLHQLDCQLIKLRAVKVRRVTIQKYVPIFKVGQASAGAKRKSARVLRGIAQAKLNVAKAIVANASLAKNYSLTSQINTLPVFNYGSCINSLYSKVNVVCLGNPSPEGRATSAFGDSQDNEPKITTTETKTMKFIADFIKSEKLSEISQEQIAQMQEIALDDYSCGVYTCVESAYKATVEEILGEPFVNYSGNNNLQRPSIHIPNRGDGNLVKNVETAEVVSCADSATTDSQVVKTNNTTTTTTTKTMTNKSDSFAAFLASFIFDNGAKSLRMDISQEQIANEAAKRAKQYDTFVDTFADLLATPDDIDLLVISKPKIKEAVATTSTKLARFFEVFNCYGVNDKGEPAEVKFAGVTLEPKPETLLSNTHLLTNAAAFFARTLAVSTANLTVAQKLQFCKAIFQGLNRVYKITETSLIISDVEFNLVDGSVTTANQVRYVNAEIEIDGAAVNGTHAVFILALCCFGNSTKAIGVVVNRAVALFKRDENYGAKLTQTDLAHSVANNLQLTLEFVPSQKKNSFPFFAINSGQQKETRLAEVLNNGEIAVVDKYNMKWMAKGVGAEAVLLGRTGNVVYNLNDAGKTAKVYNRPASIKYTFANVVGRTKSHFAVALSNGDKVYSCGKKLRTVISTKRFGHGDGVAEINPKLGFDYTVPKSLSTVFNILTLPAAMRANRTYAEVTASMLSNIKGKIEKAVGRVYGSGDSVIEFSLLTSKHVVLHNNAKAVDIRVLGGKAIATNDFEIDVKLDVEIVGEGEQYVKLRGIGKKMTTLPYVVTGIEEDWDILLNINTLKGYPALVEMYANSFGKDCFYNSNTGVLTTPEGEVDLTVADNAFTQWASKAKETIVSSVMSRSCYEANLAVIEPYLAESLEALKSLVDSGIGKDVYVEDNGEPDSVVLHERIQYIVGDVVFDVEVATPKESVSTTSLTLESANGLLLQDRLLGEAVMSDMTTKLKGTKSLVESFMNLGELPTFNVRTQAGRDGIKAAFKVAPAESGEFVNHRVMLNELKIAFPNGFVVESPTQTGKISFEIHPCALSAFGGFTGNGSATREVAEVINFIYFITDRIGAEASVDRAINKMCGELSNTLKWWATNLVQSSSVMKKFTRSGSLIGGKVRTTYSPLCNSREVIGKDGVVFTLPVVAINPDGPMATFLGVKSGDVVGFWRTPMPFMTACIVIKDESVPVGHVSVAPEVFHAGTEGDCDGDGITLMNLSKYGVNYDRAAKINSSLMGSQGYYYMYGSKLPYYGFASYDDKWGTKKSLTIWDKPVVTTMSVDEYGEGAVKVAQHYKFNVGTSYAVCSQLIFATANQLYKEPEGETFQTMLKATVLAWRGIYEGLGLSGYSPEASEVFNVLKFAAYDHVNCHINRKNDGSYTFGFITEDVVEKEVDAIAILEKHFGAHVGRDVLRRIVRSRATCITYRQIENKGCGSFNAKSSLRKLIPAAIVAGTLRRLGQGNDPVEVQEAESFAREEQGPESLLELFHSSNYGTQLGNLILAKVAADGVFLHGAVANELASRAQQELMGW